MQHMFRGTSYPNLAAMIRAQISPESIAAPKSTKPIAPSSQPELTVAAVTNVIYELERIHDDLFELGRANDEADRANKPKAYYDRHELQEELRALADTLRLVPGIPVELAREQHKVDQARRYIRRSPLQARLHDSTKEELIVQCLTEPTDSRATELRAQELTHKMKD